MAERIKHLRELLIEEGIREINNYGLTQFSVRRVSAACGVSCAAPYKHFKDKRDFIAAIIDYVNDQWAERQEQIVAQAGDSLREQIIAICIGYIRFLMDVPTYRNILMLKDEEFDNLYHKKRTQFGSLTQTLNAQLYQASGYTPEVWERKLLMCRSLIFGSLVLFDAGEFEYNEKNMEYIRYTINREFDIL